MSDEERDASDTPDETGHTAGGPEEDRASDVPGEDGAFDALADEGDASDDGAPLDGSSSVPGVGGGSESGTVEETGDLDAPDDSPATGAHAGSSLDRSPFEELEDEHAEGDLDDLFEEAFTDESVEDPEAVWEELASFEGPSHGTDEEDVIPKRSFCEQCPHLSEPPEFRCTHEGTEIVEFVDSEHVRVRECPIVAERRGAEVE